MKQTKKWLAAVLAACMLLTLAACGSRSADPAPTATPEPSPSPSPASELENALAISLAGEPSTLDPALNVKGEGTMILCHLLEGLMTRADSGKAAAGGLHTAQVVPGAAESYERKENGDETVTYTFHLRPDAKWSDGKAVTAQDFVYAWQRLVDPATGAAYADLLESVVNAYAVAAGYAQPSDLAVWAEDDATFCATVYDTPFFLELCALPATAPLRQDLVEKGGSRWSYSPETFVTNGPYCLSGWDGGAHLILERSETYAPQAAGPETIVFYFGIDDAKTIASAMEAGNLDGALGAGVSGEAYAPYMATYYLCFQTKKAPFNDPQVRKAFSLAVDRAALAADVVPGQTPASGQVPYGIYDAAGVSGKDFRTVGGELVDPDSKSYPSNCDQARALLAQAGYPDGQGFPEVSYLYPANETHRAVAQALQEMWQTQLGVTVALREESWGDFRAAAAAGDFSIARGRWVADYNDPTGFLALWTADDEGNEGGYSNAQFDDLVIDSVGHIADSAKRMELLHQAEDLLVAQDCAVAPLYFETKSYRFADHVKGVFYDPLGLFFFTGCTK